jgi:hypothetical protein
MLNRLLGAVSVPIGEEIDRRARGAAEAFLKLHGKPMSDATDGVGEAPSF